MQQLQIVEYEGEGYLDGALADSIPIDKCMEKGYDKIIVVLTKPMNYRKKKHPEWIAKMFYKKHPKLVEAINTRYLQYNKTMDKIEQLEKEISEEDVIAMLEDLLNTYKKEYKL